MPEVVLHIRGEAGELQRALGQSANAVKAAQAAMTAEAKRGAAARQKADAEEVAQARRDFQTMLKARQQAEREETKAKLRELVERQRAEEKANKERAASFARAAKVVESLRRDELKSAAAQARDTERLARMQVAANIRAKREEAREVDRINRQMNRDLSRASQDGARLRRAQGAAGRAYDREDARDARANTSRTRAGLGYARRFVEGAAAAADSVAGETHGALESYASTENRLNRALYQASPDNREIATMRGQILAFANTRGIDFDSIATAAEQAQSEYSVFGNRTDTRQTRAVRMRSFLENMADAQDLGQDPAQFARLAGALTSSGLDAPMQHQVMRELVGVTMRGGVEAGNLTREGLQSMMGSIAQSVARLGEMRDLTPGQREARRSEAVRSGVLESVSAMEVLAPRGISARRGGNALNALSAALGSDHTQGLILDHVRHTFGANSALERQLFERDGQGRSHLRNGYRDSVAFGEAVATAVHNDPDAVRNLFSSQGRGLHQALLQPQREALAALTAIGAGGKSGFQQLREIQEGAALTNADAAQGEELFGQSTSARLTRQRNEQLLALLGSNEAVTYTQNRDALRSAHPIVSEIVNRLPLGNVIESAVVGAQTAADTQAGVQRSPVGALPATDSRGIPVDLSDAAINRMATAFATALRNAPLTATVSPVDAAQTASRAATGAGAPGPDRR